MSGWAVWGLAVVATLVVCVLVPWAAMRMFAPALRSGPLVRNYRGREVSPGLGVVWVFWIGGMVLLLVGIIAEDALGILPGSLGSSVSGDDALLQLTFVGYAFAALMAIPAFVFGMIDDALGGGAEKGFGGHIRELARGRLSTGGLKMVGIGIAAAFVALVIGAGLGKGWPHAVFSFLLVPLAANFVNLTDLRPLRALKVYASLAILVAVTVPIIWWDAGIAAGVSAIVVLIVALGPVAAIWRYDAREQGMLGDAGANPAGAVAGVMMAIWWPTWAVAVAAGVLLALNLASERISFSSVIERNRALSWADGLGRTAGAGE
jgi:hypothetical protein